MNRHTPNRPVSAGNPIANVLVVIVGVLTIGAFIVLGAVAAVILGAVILVFAAVLGIRMWWLGRKLPKHDYTTGGQDRSGPTGSTVIEGEFRVVSADPDDDRPD